MKTEWEYEKLGNVCVSFSGYTPSADLLKDKGIYPYFKVAEMNRPQNKRTLISTNAYIDNPSRIYKKGAIVFPKNGAAISTNKKRVLAQDSVVDLNTGGFLVDDIKLNNWYFFYYMQHLDFQMFVRRGAVPTLDIAELKKLDVPIPSLSEQQHIVEELDLLSSIIEKKKAQLNELDNLAQSLFYEMFGDPITNDKGWEVRKLNDIYKLKSGDGLSAKNFVEGIYPVYGGNGISGYHNAYNMNGDFIIIGRVGAYCGNVRYVKGLFWLTDNAFQLFFDANIQTPVFVLYLLTLLDLHRFANEAAQPVISNKTLRDLDIIIPTMEMQEQFASKIEAIEHQKELIKQSIKEVETLFNSRMDYYFN